MEARCNYRIGEVARLCGVSPRTIDYYTQIGVLRSACRSNGNYRLYDESTVERLRLVKAYQERGLHLTEIVERLAISETSGVGEVKAHLERLERLLEEAESEMKALAEQRTRSVGGVGSSEANGANGANEVRRVAREALRTALALSLIAASLM